ncbi:hypothetical protein ACFP2T_13535 [Plantactinospora solaniradicis]|uniref:Terminase small subunit n=1 Tax=Plantactinospora solaniradicis TaxID=1723736 RepID=A0ABW1K6W9_9ACTN
MVDATAAERQRRYRRRQAAHKAGDHSECDPARCDPSTVTVTATVTQDPVTVTAPILGVRGRRLWRQFTADGSELRPAEQVLLEEACRLADRLDRLDAMLRGDEDAWARFHSLNEDGSIVQVVINNLLSEARQQQSVLKQLLAELRQARSVGLGLPGVQPTPEPAKGGAADVPAGVASIAARIARKRGDQAAG